VSAGIGVLVGVLVYIIGSVIAIKLAKLDTKEAAKELFLGNVESLREDLNKVVTTTGKPPTRLPLNKVVTTTGKPPTPLPLNKVVTL
jgi:hypothetical protein